MLAAGIWLGGHPQHLPAPLRDAFVDPRAALSTEVTKEIEDSYYKAADPKLLESASIDGMIAALRKRYGDRFSHYFSPSDFAKFKQLTSGEFSGVGLSVRQIKAGLRVTEVFPGTPARAAGIRAGDQIVAVNGRSIARRDAQLTTAEIKGRPGTRVRVTVVSPPAKARRELTLERRTIQIPVARGRIERAGGKPVAYVRLSTFSRGSHAAVRDQVDRLYAKGAQGLVLDLRRNGGGLLAEAVLNASNFLPRGELVVTTKGRRQDTHVYRAFGGPVPRKPMVVLIDRDTASAAEILTAALGDHRLAEVVGTRSFGKGVFQQVTQLENGGGLDLTVGEYLTPKGLSLAGKGVQPDVAASDKPKTKADEGLSRALAVLGSKL
ncbi:MAG: carboxyl-terminal processing protease [Solirubrobacterales bacterium]|nr:carboxyl-terminal processing protease [Solirubrobacterales bacterium]